MASWLGTLVAERELENADRPRRKAALRIGAPREKRDGSYECRYEIRGFGALRRMKVYGVDGLQALMLALLAARSELARMGNGVQYLEDPAYLSIPVMAGTHLPKRFVDRIEKSVERVHASFYSEARKRASR